MVKADLNAGLMLRATRVIVNKWRSRDVDEGQGDLINPEIV